VPPGSYGAISHADSAPSDIGILEPLGSVATVDEVLSNYPFLEREEVYAAIEYAAYQGFRDRLRNPQIQK
jgi:hypothetical protein